MNPNYVLKTPFPVHFLHIQLFGLVFFRMMLYLPNMEKNLLKLDLFWKDLHDFCCSWVDAGSRKDI